MIRVWDKDIKFIGYITNVSSVQWHSKFADYGTFEIHIPIYDIDYILLEKYNIIQFNNNYGFILSRKQTPKEIIISGYDLNGLTARRVASYDSGYDGTETKISTYMQGLLGSIGNVDAKQLGETAEKITIAEFGKLYRCSEWLKKAYEACGIGYKIYLDNDLIKCKVLEQQASPLVFSEKYKNITDFSYTEDFYTDYDIAAYNYLYNNRWYIGNIMSNAYTGNKIVYNCFAYDDVTFNKNTLSEPLLWDEERKIINALSNASNVTESVEFESNLIYGIDYNLGDIVTVEFNAFGKSVSKALTITEVQEVHEPNKTQYTITTGKKGDNYIKRLTNKGVI